MGRSRWEEWGEVDPVGSEFLDVAQSLAHTIEITAEVLDTCGLIFALR